MQQKSGDACAGMPGERYGAKSHRLIDSATRLPTGSSHHLSWSIVTEEMFGGQHRIDEAGTARASQGDTSEATQPPRHDSRAKGKVCAWTEKIRRKSLETVGIVRNNAFTGQTNRA
jgi:hypothetical protein